MANNLIDISVQDCEFWQEGHCDCYYNEEISETYPHCIDIPDCYYKQLQYKIQECEALKTLAKKYLADYFEVNEKCEELKEKVAKANNQAIHNLAMSERHSKALGKIEKYIKEFYYCESCENRETLDHILNLINAAIGGEFKRACELYKPAFAALSNWMNSESGRFFLKSLEVAKKNRGGK